MSDTSFADGPSEIVIEGAPIERGSLLTFLARGRHIHAALHPYSIHGVSWVAGDLILHDGSEEREEVGTVRAAESRIYRLPGVLNGLLAGVQKRHTDDLASSFHQLQLQYNNEENEDPFPFIVTCCREYRGFTSDAIEKAVLVAETEGLEEADEDHLQSLYDMNATLHLAEAIFFTDEEDMPRGDLLMEWLNTLDPQPAQQEGEEIMMARSPCEHPSFWDYISKGVLRGLFTMAAECLAGSGLAQRDTASARASAELQVILRSCPRITTYAKRIDDFKARYRQWRAKVILAARLLDQLDPELSSAFRQIYELLKGDKDAIFCQCDSWQESLAALSLLFDPTGCKSPKDVFALFDLVSESEMGVDRTLPANMAAADLCAGRIPQAIAHLRQVSFEAAALLADLLDKAGLLDELREDSSDFAIREILVLGLGDNWLSTQEAWAAAVSLWRSCGDAGFDRIQQILPRIPIHSQEAAGDILDLCHELELAEEARTIGTVWAKFLERGGQHGEAITAFDRAANYAQINRLTWTLFRKSCLEGQPSSSDPYFVESLQAPTMMASRELSALLAPYATIVGLHQSRQAGDMLQCAVHLMALLRYADLPKEYIPILMVELLPLLDVSPRLLSPRDVFDALAALEEFQESDQDLGMQVLQQAREALPSSRHDWRHGIPEAFDARDVLDLVRLKLARYIGTV